MQEVIATQQETSLGMWAKRHTDEDFAILRSEEAKEYWRADEVYSAVIDSVAESFQKQIDARKARPNKTQKITAKEDATWVKEEDGIILEHGGNASRSVATVVKAFAVSHRSAFHDVDSSITVAISLGLNSILELSSKHNSQRGLFHSEDWARIECLGRKISKPDFEALCDIKHFETVCSLAQSSIANAETKTQKFASKARKSSERKIMTICAYMLHLFKNHEYIFDHCTGLSEMDYAVKNTEIPLPLLTSTHWGETISEQTRTAERPIGMKMDTRILGYSVKSKAYETDLACAELSHFPSTDKIGHDRAKVLIAAKAHLDEIIGKNQDTDTYVMEMQIASLEFDILALSLPANGLYVSQLVGSAKLPVSHFDLEQLKETCILLFTVEKAVSNNLHLMQSVERKKTNKTKLRSSSTDECAKRNWTRGTWIPPQVGRLPSPPPKNLIPEL